MAKQHLKNMGYLILRVGIGLIFIKHGYPKIAGGPETWENLGSTLNLIGVDFLPVFFGFMAAISELIGGFLLILGLFTRLAAAFLLVTMLVATLKHFLGDGGYSHALTNAIVFLCMLLTGGGRFSLDERFLK
jgi:putative oxidoreductase